MTARRGLPHLAALALLLAPVWPVTTAADFGSDFSVVDRREIDGTVLVLPRVRADHPGPDPFVAATAWDLTVASDYFRVRTDRIAARTFNVEDHLPATTFENGNVVANSLVSSLGGGSKHSFEPGEIVRLIDLNTAFKSVRMDLAAVCRGDDDGGQPPRGCAVFVLGGQVGKKTLAEANAAVSAELEPIGLSQVVRHCDPSTGEPPFALRAGQEVEKVLERLGPAASTRRDGNVEILDYVQVVVHVGDGRVTRLVVPAFD